MAKSKKAEKLNNAKKDKKNAENRVEQKGMMKTETGKVKVFKGFFAKKHDATENILTIFSRPTTYAALIAEFFGTALIAMLLVTIGVSNPIFLLFTLVAVTLAMHTLSGSHFNPLITAGMMATRRTSVIRGVLYVLMQVFGAWFGYGLVNIFVGAASKGGTSPLQTMAKLGENVHLVVLMELIGAIMIGFFYVRAMIYKKHAFMFSVIVAGGVMTAVLLMLVASSMAQMSGNGSVFILNPAVAIIYQILPNSGNNAGEIIMEIAAALGVYFAIPMIGGTIGAYLSDFVTKLSGAELE